MAFVKEREKIPLSSFIQAPSVRSARAEKKSTSKHLIEPVLTVTEQVQHSVCRIPVRSAMEEVLLVWDQERKKGEKPVLFVRGQEWKWIPIFLAPIVVDWERLLTLKKEE